MILAQTNPSSLNVSKKETQMTTKDVFHNAEAEPIPVGTSIAKIDVTISKIKSLRDAAATEGEKKAAEEALCRLRREDSPGGNTAKAAATSTTEGPSLRITAAVENIDRDESYYEILFVDLEGRERTRRIERAMFYQPWRVVDALAKSHAYLPDERGAAIDLVKSAIANKADRQYRVTATSGFVNEDSFVHPRATYGKLAGKLVWDASNNIDPALGMLSGSLDAWRRGMREPIKKSDYLLLACCISLASALLPVIGEDEGAIFHLHGTRARNTQSKTKSSSGKSLANRVAASVTGRCRKNDLVTFAASARSIEDYCFAHNHLGAQFDEEGRSLGSGTGPRIKPQEMAYLIASGRGGLRSVKATRDPDLANVTFSLFALSTGETPLDDPLTRKEARPEGSQVRMICLPVSPGVKGGIFNRVKGTPEEVAATCKSLARQVGETIVVNYGVVAPAFLPKLLAADRITLKRRVRNIIDKFIVRVGADTDPWERRFAEKFGIILAAAILLSEWKIGPWTKRRAHGAIRRLYQLARSAVVSAEEATAALVQKLTRALGSDFPS
jgi:hypothetical protein